MRMVIQQELQRGYAGVSRDILQSTCCLRDILLNTTEKGLSPTAYNIYHNIRGKGCVIMPLDAKCNMVLARFRVEQLPIL